MCTKLRKFHKPREKKKLFLFRGAQIKTKSKLSGMTKFILTYPVAAKVERRENVFSFPRCSSADEVKWSNVGVSQSYEEKLEWQKEGLQYSVSLSATMGSGMQSSSSP